MTCLRFIDEKALEQAQVLVKSYNKTCARYRLETTLITNSANIIQREIEVIGQKLESVASLK